MAIHNHVQAPPIISRLPRGGGDSGTGRPDVVNARSRLHARCASTRGDPGAHCATSTSRRQLVTQRYIQQPLVLLLLRCDAGVPYLSFHFAGGCLRIQEPPKAVLLSAHIRPHLHPALIQLWDPHICFLRYLGRTPMEHFKVELAIYVGSTSKQLRQKCDFPRRDERMSTLRPSHAHARSIFSLSRLSGV